MDALDLLSGDAQAFVEKVWASRVHLHETDPALLVGMLSLDDVDRLLTTTAIRTPAVRLAQNGSVLPESRYTRGGSLAGRPLTGLVDPRKLLDLFEGGASVVLQGLQRYWPPLTELVARLEAELGHPCQANAYLTPPGSQGFAVHADTHDVFVFQTHGSKLWEVHDDEGRHDVLLEPGRVMYLPTGTRHAARAQDTASLHVTLGINQLTWRSLLDRVVRRELADLPDLDAHLPAAYADRPGSLAEGLADRLDALATALRGVDMAAEESRQVRDFHTTRPARLGGGLVERLALADIEPTTRVQRRPDGVMRLVDEPDRLLVLLGDRELRVPARLRPALERIATGDVVRPADLPLDEASAVVLVRRLVREGACRVLA